MRSKYRTGFTLVELLVVIAIISILLGILFPAVQMIRETGRRTQCQSRMRQIGLALAAYHSEKGRFPSAHWQNPQHFAPDPVPPKYPNPPQTNGNYISWLAQILPFVEQTSIYNEIEYVDFPWPNPAYPANGIFVNGLDVQPYLCPSNSRTDKVQHTFAGNRTTEFAHTNYLGVNGTNQFAFDGIIHVNSQTTITDIPAGLSNTLIVGERPPTYDGWYGWWFADAGVYPWFGAAGNVLGIEEDIADPDFRCRPGGPTSNFQRGSYRWEDDGAGWDKHAWHFWSAHPSGANFVRGDASVEFMSYSADLAVMRQLATRAAD